MSEHDEQAAFFRWCELSKGQHPELGYFYAIPNGGKRHVSVAKRLKAEGVKAGVLDTHLPVKHGAYIGLWIEFKFGNNDMSAQQEAWAQWLIKHGHRVEVARSWTEAATIALEYLEIDNELPFS